MKNNDNDLVSSCFEYVSNNANSILGNKIAYMRRGITKWDICRDFLILRYIHILILAFVIFNLNK